MKALLIYSDNGLERHPLARGVPMCALPVYDQPLLFYGINCLLQWGDAWSEIIIMGSARTLQAGKALFPSDFPWGAIRLRWMTRPADPGLFEALATLGPKLKGEPLCILFGHHLFFSHESGSFHPESSSAARLFTLNPPPRRMRSSGESDPPRLFPAATFPGDIGQQVAELSSRGEASSDFASLVKIYADQRRIETHALDAECACFSFDDFDDYWAAARRLENIEVQTGRKLACLESQLLSGGYIDLEAGLKLYERLPAGSYRKALGNWLGEMGCIDPAHRHLRLVR